MIGDVLFVCVKSGLVLYAWWWISFQHTLLYLSSLLARGLPSSVSIFPDPITSSYYTIYMTYYCFRMPVFLSVWSRFMSLTMAGSVRDASSFVSNSVLRRGWTWLLLILDPWNPQVWSPWTPLNSKLNVFPRYYRGSRIWLLDLDCRSWRETIQGCDTSIRRILHDYSRSQKISFWNLPGVQGQNWNQRRSYTPYPKFSNWLAL
jgi:hypothetical protein